jgi:predicted N-formylglutamate amidohydrolase
MDAHPAARLPSFSTRLGLIAKAIKNYEAFDPGVIRYMSLAEQIVFRLKAGNSI